MANDQTYNNGFGSDGGQITTLADIQGAGLTLPSPPNQFINIRQGGKIQTLFETANNANFLYSINRPNDLYFSDFLSNRFDYKNPIQGQARKQPITFLNAASEDQRLMRRFDNSNYYQNYVRRNSQLQLYNAFDETKIFNRFALRANRFYNASGVYGFLFGKPYYGPVNHIDTGNILAGLLGGLGSSNYPQTPRSTVASEGGLGSFFGFGDRRNEVLPLLGRRNVKGLLRGKTASDAYSGEYYGKYIPGSNSIANTISKLSRPSVLSSVFNKQPVDAKYRADEDTYRVFIKNGTLFNVYNRKGENGSTESVLVDLGSEEKPGFFRKLATAFGYPPSRLKLNINDVRQRFISRGTNLYNLESIDPIAKLLSRLSGNSSNSLNLNRYRLIITQNNPDYGGYSTAYVPFIGKRTTDSDSIDSDSSINESDSNLTYVENVGYIKRDGSDEKTEYSDILYNYKYYSEFSKEFKRTHSDNPETSDVNSIISTYNKSIENIVGQDKKYVADDTTQYLPLQYSRFNSSNDIGFDQLKNTKSWRNKGGSAGSTYKGKINISDTSFKYPSLSYRKIRPTNDVDYVNFLEVLNSEEFDEKYKNNWYGHDLINFYFYDVVNEKYIPFNATLKGITEQNSATIDSIEYIGRADKMYTYKGYSRNVSFNFKCVAHSIKELIPMWKRISYLVSLTRPANYTNNQRGFIVPPIITFTIGDLYKDQPGIFESCTPSIDENAIWETLPMSSNIDWSFGLNDKFVWENSSEKYAQLPTECEISVNVKIIEKQLPRAGGNLWATESLLQTT